MADVLQFPQLISAPVVQTRGPGRYPKSITNLRAIIWDRHLARERARSASTESDAQHEITLDGLFQEFHEDRMLIERQSDGTWRFRAYGVYTDPACAINVLWGALISLRLQRAKARCQRPAPCSRSQQSLGGRIMDNASAVVLTHPAFHRSAVDNEVRRGRPAGTVSLALARRRQLDRRAEERRVAESLPGDAITINFSANGDLEYKFSGRFRESRREIAAALAQVLTAVLE